MIIPFIVVEASSFMKFVNSCCYFGACLQAVSTVSTYQISSAQVMSDNWPEALR